MMLVVVMLVVMLVVDMIDVLVVASRRWMGGWGVGVVVVVEGDLPRSLPIVRTEQDFSTYCDRDFLVVEVSVQV